MTPKERDLRLADLKAKLEASRNVNGMAERCKALKAEIARLETM